MIITYGMVKVNYTHPIQFLHIEKNSCLFSRCSTQVAPTFSAPIFWVLSGCYLGAIYCFSAFSTTPYKDKKPRRIALRGDFSYDSDRDKIISSIKCILVNTLF